jgi:hypothetical protein
MLITVSGMVGSGKSTASKRIIELVEAAGGQCQYVRFRSLGFFGLRSAPGGPATATDAALPARTAGPRWSGFRPRTLTLLIACGYAVRILAFRAFGPRRSSPVYYVIDRFFYDNFVHYALRSRRERVYAAALARLVPRPDLAILLLASADTLRERRPDYAPAYISVAGLGYSRLPAQFPALVTVETDPGQPSGERLERVIVDLLERSGWRPQTRAPKEAI